MPDIIIAVKATELTEAVNNLSKAYMAAAGAINSLAAKYQNTAGFTPGTAPLGFQVSQTQGPNVIQSGNTGRQQTSASRPEPYRALLPEAKPGANLSQAQASPARDVTLDDLARAAARLMSSGKYMVLVELLSKFGVQALFQLPKEHFGAFAEALRQIGAFI